MLLEFFIGFVIGALVGITIAACITIAQKIFDNEPNVRRVEVIKKDSDVFEEVMRKIPRLRAALNGESTGIVLTYENGRISKCTSIEKNFGSDFQDCSGLRFNRNRVDEPIKI